MIVLHKPRDKSLKIKQIIEAKYASQKKGWLWAVEQDVKITIRNGHDENITMEFFNWVKDHEKTLDHLYRALQDDAQAAADFLENNWGRAPDGGQLNFYWIGELDYTELAVYQALRKILPAEELDYVARLLIDVVADENKNET